MGYSFKSDAQQRKLSDLSGGELNRVHLARKLLHGPNVILLDEPTNDLDVEVLRSLEDGISNFAGSAIIGLTLLHFLLCVESHFFIFFQSFS